MSASPITAREFLAAVEKLWKPLASVRGPFPLANIGLCISGGPDSMALAYLVSRLRHEGLAPDLKATAFIIDHKARPESTDEALLVSKWVNDLGLRARVLTMQWPDNTDFSGKRARFETEARQRRYRLLGEACQRFKISSLFLGHHANDSAETIIMRMAYNLGAFSGLKGISPVGPIPCCEDMYGIDPRGPPLTLSLSRDPSKMWMKALVPQLAAGTPSDSPKGVLLVRPLLGHLKSQLVATCQQNTVPFVSDPTNLDPSFTARNATRYLLSNYKLPRALQQPSIMTLADKSAKHDKWLDDKADSILRQIEVYFDPRSGSLRTQFPPVDSILASISQKNEPNEQSSLQNDAIAIMSRVVLRLIEVVKPLVKYDAHHRSTLWQVSRLVVSMFPDLASKGEIPVTPIKGPFSYSHVTIQSNDLASSSSDNNEQPIWSFSRSMRGSESSSFVPETLQSASSHSKWLLWDGRYWVRMFNIPDSEVSSWSIRLLRVEDMSYIRTQIWKYGRGVKAVEEFDAVLTAAVPDKARYTIPVIVDGDSKIRFLPTIGFKVPRKKIARESSKTIHFEIKYKATDPLILSRFKKIDYSPRKRRPTVSLSSTTEDDDELKIDLSQMKKRDADVSHEVSS